MSLRHCPNCPRVLPATNPNSTSQNLDSRRWALPACQVTSRKEIRWALFPDCSEYSDLPSRVVCCFRESDFPANLNPARFPESCSSASFRWLSSSPEHSDSEVIAELRCRQEESPFQPEELRYWLAGSRCPGAGLPSLASNSDPPNRNCWQAARLPQEHFARQATTRKEQPQTTTQVFWRTYQGLPRTIPIVSDPEIDALQINFSLIDARWRMYRSDALDNCGAPGRRAELLTVLRGLRAFFKRLAVPDPTLAGVAGELEILRQFESVDRTGVLAQAAEHAAAQVVGEIGKFLAAGLLVALARDHDQIFGTSQRTQIAGNAHGLIRVGVHVEARCAAITLGHLRPFQRILLGIDFLGILIAERNLQSLKQIDQEDFAEQAWHPHIGVSIPLTRESPKAAALLF